ncbi:hypothetical protein J2X69_002872 [Algoriphagus sp. 4150]|uniref:hypothetical protein n=1 Tax=Algoriphagus sp. 4150 TaxID=2817756 RepID=UPI0028664208|nr:hypothetical protein [Algoriphagus sp. 4150]MDR7130516.1 hypothetical protein [Algoriphagus sp. 4150]
MKFILLAFLTALLVLLFNPFMPYWAVMIFIAALTALIGSPGARAFFAGGFGMGLAWLGKSMYITTVSGSSLPEKMGELMGLDSEVILFVITGLVGFFLGAFSAWTGSLLRKLFKRKPDNIYRRY